MPSSTSRAGSIARRALLALIGGLLLIPGLPTSRAQEDQPATAPEPRQPVGRYITLESPITDDTIAWVRQTGLELQQIALQENRPAYLILEVRPGASQFHHVYALADFLTSADIPDVNTIAWVPETVVGHNVIAALAAGEIVMHSDAQIGDIGLGKALAADQQQFIRNMVAKRRNKKVNEFLATAMMDPGATLVQLTVEPQPGMPEKRLVTEQEADRVLQSGVEIRDRSTIKEAGTPGMFSGASARNLDILVVRTAGDRLEMAKSYNLPPEALREQRARGNAKTVTLIEVNGTIEPILETFLVRQIDRAVAGGAKTIIFDITSDGGMLYPSRDLAFRIADLESRDIRTVAFIDDRALSGAAFIALGCDEIYMTPNAKLGDILPLEIKQGGAIERAPEKLMTVLVEWLRDIAERKQRPVAVCMAMADPSIEVFQATNKQSGTIWYLSDDQFRELGDEWVKGPLVQESREGIPMTVGARRAHELKLAELPVAGFDELKERVGIPPDVTPFKIGRTWIDDLVFVLNTPLVMGLLFFIGIVCIYLELHFTTGLLGIISLLCFALFFWSKVLGGTAGWLEVLLFVIGLGCLAMEIFVIPGFGVFGVSGGLLIFASLIMASQTFGNLETGTDLHEATKTVGTLSAAIIAVIIMAMAISRYLPSMPLFSHMILSPPGAAEVVPTDEPRLRPDLAGSLHNSPLLGKHGKATTVLRPSGKATIDGRLIEVISDGPFINEGAALEVVRVAGNRIIVRETA